MSHLKLKRLKKKIMNFLKIILIALVITPFSLIKAQTLAANSKLDISLTSLGENITVFAEIINNSDDFSNNYYYLPANLRVAKKDNNEPQFIFGNYQTDDGSYQSGILHFLVEWGLTKEQELELQSEIRRKTGNNRAIVKGIATSNNTAANSKQKYYITSAMLNQKNTIDSTQTLLKGNTVSISGGQKAAIATSLNNLQSEMFWTQIEKETAVVDLSLAYTYQYDLRYKALSAEITFNYSRLDSLVREVRDSKIVTRRRDTDIFFLGIVPFGRSRKKIDKIVRTRTDSLIHVLETNKIVEIDIDNTAVGEDKKLVAELTKQFIELFLQNIGTLVDVVNSNDSLQTPEVGYENIDDGISWEFDADLYHKKVQQGKETYKLRSRSTITKQESTPAINLSDWMEDIRNATGDKYIFTEILNDPNFKTKHINVEIPSIYSPLFNTDNGEPGSNVSSQKYFNLSLEVILEKERENDTNFKHTEQFNSNLNSKAGLTRTISYSTANSREPYRFRYKPIWTYAYYNRGVIVKEGEWQENDGEQFKITIAPNLHHQTIQFEIDDATKSDLKDSLKATNVVLELAYINNDVRQVRRLNFPPTAGVTSSADIFLDPSSSGIMSRIIISRRYKGKLATEWQSIEKTTGAPIVIDASNLDFEMIEAIRTATKTNNESSLKKWKDNAKGSNSIFNLIDDVKSYEKYWHKLKSLF